MADLDSFFAKKDKKKDKLKGRKFGNQEEIAKQLEESEKKLEKERIKVEPKLQIGDEVLTAEEAAKEISSLKEEEEWKDYVEESAGDLTDLKISRLQIENEEDGTGMGYSGEDDSAGGFNDRGDGVWKKNMEKTVIEEVVQKPKEEPKASLAADSAPTKYVSPHLRNMSSQSGGDVRSRRRPKQAPDITNERSFPSLSEAQTSAPANAWGRQKQMEEKGFENVKHGSSGTPQRMLQQGPPKVRTANRYDALSS